MRCTRLSLDCQYSESLRNASDQTSKAYTEALEQRVATLEALLESQASRPHQLHAEFDGSLMPSVIPLSPLFPEPSPRSEDNPDAVCAIADKTSNLTVHMEHLGINDEPIFLGEASGVHVTHQVLGMRSEAHGSAHMASRSTSIRPQYWQKRPWERALESDAHVKVDYHFPHDELLTTLVDLYFNNVNTYMPLLHRPTFERSIRESKHLIDLKFAETVLLVCAIGSRYCDDLCVRLDDALDTPFSAGWKYYMQVPAVNVNPLSRPNQYDLQKCVLVVIFLMDSSGRRGCWMLVGTGLRMCQHLGIHRQQTMDSSLSRADHERWKRIFWCLLCLDRMYAMGMGRSVALQDEDIDADLPLSVDDEYWFTDAGEELFAQPAGKPSKIQYFIAFIRLLQITAFSLRTVYSMEKTKIRMGLGPERIKEVVAELDSALNRWYDTVPRHLRWDPHREDPHFFAQSVVLHSWFYKLQIQTHRHFLLSPSGFKDDGLQTFTSLAICTNASRTVLHILHRQAERGSYAGAYISFMSVLSAAVMLHLNLWSKRNPRGPTSGHDTILSDVQKAREVLLFMEKRFFAAGKLLTMRLMKGGRDVLNELGSVSELPMSTGASAKRQHDELDSQEGMPLPSNAYNLASMLPTTLPGDFAQSGGLAFEQDAVSTLGSSQYDDYSVQPSASTHSGVLSNSDLTAGMEGNVNGIDPGLYNLLRMPPLGVGQDGSAEDDVGMPRDFGSGLWDPARDMPMWPLGMETEDWAHYLRNVGEWTQAVDEPNANI
ncbi:hypothetical protein CYLTODRAFT_446388 [Cylindrobasidium torrendii FP15055 ss-10]|uniref:Xylanolytic transcriptional activator regulatory domain-containing protein n=1 Tax=Cylindrobasidium torrendii FP15055 ss-10 TaxID=1314674 RepID=A0A0D7B0X4_9AGAR|nr:hypothetical protein CYLTODRAFT_446388 [Cylindrobasidium torrendii FP15055 ss-10]